MTEKTKDKLMSDVRDFMKEECFENPSLETRILFRHILCDQDNVLELTNEHIKRINHHMNELKKGMPIQRQLGFTEVRDRKINITQDVLLPGPEIEILLDTFFDYVKNPKRVVDLCTGCGVLASIIGEAFPNTKVYASDISKKALEVAKTNIRSGNVQLLEGDLFEPLEKLGIYNLDVLISNPPYCKTEDIEKLPRQIKDYTPRIAIDGGEDGYSFHRRIIRDSSNFVKIGGLMILENEAGQTKKLCNMLQSNRYYIECTRKNHRGEERVVVARRTK